MSTLPIALNWLLLAAKPPISSWADALAELARGASVSLDQQPATVSVSNMIEAAPMRDHVHSEYRGKVVERDVIRGSSCEFGDRRAGMRDAGSPVPTMSRPHRLSNDMRVTANDLT